MRISDWSSDVCSSDLASRALHTHACCGAGTAVYIRVHENSEHRATMYRMYECRGRMDAQERPQRSGRVTGFKRFPVDQDASDNRFPVFASPPGASLSSANTTVIGNPRGGSGSHREGVE